MSGEYYDSDTDFNPVLLRKLLLGLTVSPEIGTRLGVPVAELEQWLRDLAACLDDGLCPEKAAGRPEQMDRTSPRRNGEVLNAGEISFLLAGFDEAQTVGG